MTSKKINVAALDFDGIKSELKEFMRGQDQFKDYDFEGSSMSILLDVLAYNTHYNALYQNMTLNEMFLDSASKRNSVVSRATELGYVPRSAACAKATSTVNITMPTLGPSVISIPAFSTFSTSIDGKSYTFYNVETISGNGPATSYSIPNVTLREGSPLSFHYEVSAGARFIIPNANVDLKTLQVQIQENSTSTTYVTYASATSLVDVYSDSKVYWVREIDDGLYELTFGDGVIGNKLNNGNVIHIDYFVSSLDAPNGARMFNYTGPSIGNNAIVTVTTTSIATGGAEPESIGSIKQVAPMFRAAQNRAVIPNDYAALIYNALPEAKSINVWGGEDNIPPVYGKTFICVKPKQASKLTEQQKSDIINSLLSSKNVVSIIPEIVDPEYINISLNVTVYYDSRATTLVSKQIESLVRDTIIYYDENELQQFDGVFRYSRLSRLIDTTEKSIASNITRVMIRREIQPKYNLNAEYNVNLINPIYTTGTPLSRASIVSTGFFIPGSDNIHFIQDDGMGAIQLYYQGTSGLKVIVNPKIGIVDYAKGSIHISGLTIAALADVSFELNIRPQSNDVVSAFTQIAQISPENLRVEAIADKTINGDLRGGTNFQFTSSRS